MSVASRRQYLMDAVITGTLGFIAFLVGFGRSPLDLKEPIGAGDLTYYYALVNANAPFSSISPRFGFPLGFDSSYFPVSDWIQILSAQAISAITGTTYFGLNATYALSFPVAAIFAWFACRLASMPRVLSILVGIAFTALPSHWFRVEHITLVTIYSLAVSLCIAMIIVTGRIDRDAPAGGLGRRAWILIACGLAIVVALSGLYYTFYGVMLVLLAVLFRVSKASTVRGWALNLVPVLVAGAVTLMAMSPGISTRLSSDGEVGYERPIYDAVLYSGQLIDAILPTSVSLMPLLGQLSRPLAGVNDWANEMNTLGVRWIADHGTTLTLLAAVFLVLWIALWGGSRHVAHDRELARADRVTIRQIRSNIVFLVTAAVLTAGFFMPFGFGTYFATAVTLNFRGWDRMITLFQLLLLVALGLIASLALLRVRQSRRELVLVIGVALAAGSILLDAVWPARSFYDAQLLKGQEQVHAASMVVDDVEAAAPDGCPILQLPYRQFPEAAPLERLGVYEPLWLGLVDRTRPWSYGGVYGSAQDQWLLRIAADPVARLGELKAAGFCGILVDARGYTPQGLDEVTADLDRGLGQPVVAQGVEPVLIYRIP